VTSLSISVNVKSCKILAFYFISCKKSCILFSLKFIPVHFQLPTLTLCSFIMCFFSVWCDPSFIFFIPFFIYFFLFFSCFCLSFFYCFCLFNFCQFLSSFLVIFVYYCFSLLSFFLCITRTLYVISFSHIIIDNIY